MIIKDKLFGEEWRIKKEKYCWTVQKYSHKHGSTEIWKSTDFYSSIKDAALRILKYKLLDEHKDKRMDLAEYILLMRANVYIAERFANSIENHKSAV